MPVTSWLWQMSWSGNPHRTRTLNSAARQKLLTCMPPHAHTSGGLCALCEPGWSLRSLVGCDGMPAAA